MSFSFFVWECGSQTVGRSDAVLWEGCESHMHAGSETAGFAVSVVYSNFPLPRLRFHLLRLSFIFMNSCMLLLLHPFIFCCFVISRFHTACSGRTATITERLCLEFHPMEVPLLRMYITPIQTCAIPTLTPPKGTLPVPSPEERWNPGRRPTFSWSIGVDAHSSKR